MRKQQFLKHNNYQYNLGLSVVDEIKGKVVSPYSKLRDLIMGQNDFIKKQNDIVQFVSLYCYEGNSLVPNVNDGEMENIWWLYCKETNTKLLPKFHYMLASTFINNNSKYDDVLNNLKRTFDFFIKLSEKKNVILLCDKNANVTNLPFKTKNFFKTIDSLQE